MMHGASPWLADQGDRADLPASQAAERRALKLRAPGAERSLREGEGAESKAGGAGGRLGRLAANRPRCDGGIAPSKLAQDAQSEPVAALPPLKLVPRQLGQRINQRVYRSIQFLRRHRVLPNVPPSLAEKGGSAGLPT